VSTTSAHTGHGSSTEATKRKLQGEIVDAGVTVALRLHAASKGYDNLWRFIATRPLFALQVLLGAKFVSTLGSFATCEPQRFCRRPADHKEITNEHYCRMRCRSDDLEPRKLCQFIVFTWPAKDLPHLYCYRLVISLWQAS
jgi:hypothetical protein